jgi:NADH dehydrogenase/NADH:ubiquinone oxidoreductase subunit G
MKLWKQAGLDKSYPEIFKLKPGTKISANNYKAFQQLALASLNVSLEKSKAEVDIDLKQAQAAESRARAIKDLAEAKNQNVALKKDQLFTDAMKAYDAAGKDITKVGAEHQGVIAEHAGKLASGLAPLYKQAVETGQNEVAQSYAQKIKDLTDLSEAAFKKTVDISKLPKPTTGTTSITSAEGIQAYARYKKEFGDAVSATAAMLQNGWSVPPPVPPEPGLLEKAGAAASKAGGAVVEFLKKRAP